MLGSRLSLVRFLNLLTATSFLSLIIIRLYIVNLAVALKTLQPQKDIGLLDADVFGPSVPLMMNVNDTPLITDGKLESTVLQHC